MCEKCKELEEELEEAKRRILALEANAQAAEISALCREILAMPTAKFLGEK